MLVPRNQKKKINNKISHLHVRYFYVLQRSQPSKKWSNFLQSEKSPPSFDLTAVPRSALSKLVFLCLGLQTYL